MTKHHLRKIFFIIVLGGTILSTLGASGFSADSASIRPVLAGSIDQVIPAAFQAASSAELQRFRPISATDGWILLGAHLYWTLDSGNSWKDISPALPASTTIQAVKFLDSQNGWVLWNEKDASGELVFQAAHTRTQGQEWESMPVETLSPEDPDILFESANMDWLDENIGWVSLKRQTGSNFSFGMLFRTEDGGLTWQRYSLPIGGPVYFASPLVGWMAGGPAGDLLFKTTDGGRNWMQAASPAAPEGSIIDHLFLPAFKTELDGLLPASIQTGDTFQLGFYSTNDGGASWNLQAALPIGQQVNRPPLTLLDAENLVATVPNTTLIIRMAAGQVSTLNNLDGLSTGIADLQMLNTELGWGKWVSSDCTTQEVPGGNGESSTSCSTITRLLKTSDGGLNWQSILFPGDIPFLLQESTAGSSTESPFSVRSASSYGLTQVMTGQGFDACTIPTIAQLQTWSVSSPYDAVNVYIGGIARGCPNPLLSTTYLDQIAVQGWKFIPTWVGPQAPCTTFNHKISSNVTQAYNDGVNEANLAVDAMAGLGLTFADKSGSVIYYDLEAFLGDQACRNAVKSFMDGWVTSLHLRGHMAGVYGSTLCTNGLNIYLTIPNVPDVIWPAIWDHSPGDIDGNYEPLATVWDAGCISTSVWNNHQRIRQYEGAHNEVWGGVTINIDNDVIDGVVAVPYYGTPSAVFSAAPLNGNSPLTVTFSIANTIYMTTCAWNYGDGQTGTTCLPNHTHTYTSAGTYSVSLTAYGPGGSNAYSRSNYIVVSQAPPTGKPDLLPSPRSPHVNPLSLSSFPSTTTDGTLYAGQPTYIDWGFKNAGTAAASATFNVDLYIDSELIMNYAFAGIAAGASAGYDDWLVTWESPGWHTVTLQVDPENSVEESNENNNTYTAQFFWETTVPAGPTTISPAGVITATVPSYSWYSVANASSYELFVYSLTAGSSVFSIPLQPAFICTPPTCTYNSSVLLAPGDYQFKVVVKYANGTSAFSAWRTFTVGTLPAVPTLLTPTGSVTDPTPSFSWTKASGASWFDLYVYPFGSETPILSQTSIPASSSCVTGTCLWNPTMPLARGNYQFKIRSGNLAGSSDFSTWGAFSVDADTDFYHVYVPYIVK